MLWEYLQYAELVALVIIFPCLWLSDRETPQGSYLWIVAPFFLVALGGVAKYMLEKEDLVSTLAIVLMCVTSATIFALFMRHSNLASKRSMRKFSRTLGLPD